MDTPDQTHPAGEGRAKRRRTPGKRQLPDPPVQPAPERAAVDEAPPGLGSPVWLQDWWRIRFTERDFADLLRLWLDPRTEPEMSRLWNQAAKAARLIEEDHNAIKWTRADSLRVVNAGWIYNESRKHMDTCWAPQAVRTLPAPVRGYLYTHMMILVGLRERRAGQSNDPLDHFLTWANLYSAGQHLWIEGKRRAAKHPAGISAALLHTEKVLGRGSTGTEPAVKTLAKAAAGVANKMLAKGGRTLPAETAEDIEGQIPITLAKSLADRHPLVALADALGGQLEIVPRAIGQDLIDELRKAADWHRLKKSAEDIGLEEEVRGGARRHATDENDEADEAADADEQVAGAGPQDGGAEDSAEAEHVLLPEETEPVRPPTAREAKQSARKAAQERTARKAAEALAALHQRTSSQLTTAEVQEIFEALRPHPESFQLARDILCRDVKIRPSDGDTYVDAPMIELKDVFGTQFEEIRRILRVPLARRLDVWLDYLTDEEGKVALAARQQGFKSRRPKGYKATERAKLKDQLDLIRHEKQLVVERIQALRSANQASRK